MAYAENTSVAVAKSRAEIEQLLTRHKCQKFMAGVDHDAHTATVQFQAHNRIVRFVLSLPDPRDPALKKVKGRYMQRTAVGVQHLVEQLERARWRALLLVIKAKLESVESGIATFEEEFLAQIVLPNDETVSAWVLPEVARIYETGRMPRSKQIGEGTVTDVTVEAE